jgi:hypothetical protein
MAEGGAMWSCNAERCTIWNNQADQGGGTASSSLKHCTVSLNVATNGSVEGGMLGGGTSNSCIVWGNSPQDVSSVLANYSNIGTGTVGGTANISMDPLFWQPLNQDFGLRSGSPCIDRGDPANANDPDGSRADMGARYFSPNHYSPPFFYCTAKVNSQGCTPSLFTTGAPSVHGGTQFRVGANDVINQKVGLLFWGRAPEALPFQGGTLCVDAPVTRTQAQISGGNTGTVDCSGSYSFHWSSSYIQSKGLQVGDRIFAQYWSRDPGASFGSGLTNAVDFTLIP